MGTPPPVETHQPPYPSPARGEIPTDFPGPLQRTPSPWEGLGGWTWSPSLRRIAPLVTGVGWLRLGSRSLQVEALRFQAKQRPRAYRFYKGWRAGGPGRPPCPGAQRLTTGAAPGLKLWDASVLAGRCEQRGCLGPGPGFGEPPVFS